MPSLSPNQQHQSTEKIEITDKLQLFRYYTQMKHTLLWKSVANNASRQAALSCKNITYIYYIDRIHQQRTLCTHVSVLTVCACLSISIVLMPRLTSQTKNLLCTNRVASRTLFSYKNLGSMAREFLQKCEMLRCENSTLVIICPLLLINSINITVLWAGLAKRNKGISCSRNLVAARNFYDARRTLYENHENLVEKSVRHASDIYTAMVTVATMINITG